MLLSHDCRSLTPLNSRDFPEIFPDPDRFLTQLPEGDSSDLLFNGDFEAGVRPVDANFGSMATAALLPGWNFGRDVAVSLNSENGTRGVGLRGETIVSSTADVQVSFRNAGPKYTVGTLDYSIWQSFATGPGRRCEVRFEMGGYVRFGGDLRVTATVNDGSRPSGPPLARMAATRSGADFSDSGDNAATKFAFTARSARATLILAETSPQSDHAAPVIDNVSVRLLPE